MVHPETGEKFLLHNMPPFIINIFIGSEKPLQDTLMRECVEEFAKLRRTEANKLEPRIFVNFERIVADGPAGTDLTGRKPHMGYWSTPRCKQEGKKSVNATTKKRTGGLFFPIVDCDELSRQDEDWVTESTAPLKTVTFIHLASCLLLSFVLICAFFIKSSHFIHSETCDPHYSAGDPSKPPNGFVCGHRSNAHRRRRCFA
jgi:hypothetical protein